MDLQNYSGRLAMSYYDIFGLYDDGTILMSIAEPNAIRERVKVNVGSWTGIKSIGAIGTKGSDSLLGLRHDGSIVECRYEVGNSYSDVKPFVQSPIEHSNFENWFQKQYFGTQLAKDHAFKTYAEMQNWLSNSLATSVPRFDKNGFERVYTLTGEGLYTNKVSYTYASGEFKTHLVDTSDLFGGPAKYEGRESNVVFFLANHSQYVLLRKDGTVSYFKLKGSIHHNLKSWNLFRNNPIPQSVRWRDVGLCQHCGGTISGTFFKKCKKCKK